MPRKVAVMGALLLVGSFTYLTIHHFAMEPIPQPRTILQYHHIRKLQKSIHSVHSSRKASWLSQGSSREAPRQKLTQSAEQRVPARGGVMLGQDSSSLEISSAKRLNKADQAMSKERRFEEQSLDGNIVGSNFVDLLEESLKQDRNTFARSTNFAHNEDSVNDQHAQSAKDVFSEPPFDEILNQDKTALGGESNLDKFMSLDSEEYGRVAGGKSGVGDSKVQHSRGNEQIVERKTNLEEFLEQDSYNIEQEADKPNQPSESFDRALSKEYGLQKTNPFTKALLEHANKDKLIYLSSVDSSYVSLALNLYETSFKPLQIQNYLFVCSDTKAFQSLQQHGVSSFDYLHDKDGKTPSSYGSSAFKRKTHLKTKIVLNALFLGLTVIIIDVDIVLFKDPVPYLLCDDCDIQIQSDLSEGNSGFYMARPTKGSIILHQQAWDKAQYYAEKMSNQAIMNKVMHYMWQTGQVKVGILPLELFPPGKVYFEENPRMFYYDNPPQNEVLMHNNWIVSKAAKIYRFKEQLLWRVDTDGYYSDPTRKYLTYRNIGSDGSQATETEALKTAMLIGHLLNRTVILPTFSCEHCQSKSCEVPSQQCAFNAHYKIETFDSFYKNQYREHVFLDHPLVPSSSCEGSEVFLIQPSIQGHLKYPPQIKVLRPKDYCGPTEKEIYRWFSDVTEPVLQFYSLHNNYGNFKDKSFIKDEAFNTRTNYMQFDQPDEGRKHVTQIRQLGGKRVYLHT